MVQRPTPAAESERYPGDGALMSRASGSPTEWPRPR